MDFVKISQNPVGLDMDLQGITIKIPFPLYSVHSPTECQILGLVLWNSRTQVGFQVELAEESKDLCTQMTMTLYR